MSAARPWKPWICSNLSLRDVKMALVTTQNEKERTFSEALKQGCHSCAAQLQKAAVCWTLLSVLRQNCWMTFGAHFSVTSIFRPAVWSHVRVVVVVPSLPPPHLTWWVLGCHVTGYLVLYAGVLFYAFGLFLYEFCMSVCLQGKKYLSMDLSLSFLIKFRENSETAKNLHEAFIPIIFSRTSWSKKVHLAHKMRISSSTFSVYNHTQTCTETKKCGLNFVLK